MSVKEKEYRKNYYENNKDKIKQNIKNWFNKNPTYKQLRDKKYIEENKEQVQEYWRNQKRKNNLKKKQYIDDYKKQNCCIKCNEDRYYVLDFHHKDPSEKSFNLGNATKYGMKTIKNEIKKCILLCRNCHSEFHFLNKKDKITLKEYISQ